MVDMVESHLAIPFGENLKALHDSGESLKRNNFRYDWDAEKESMN